MNLANAERALTSARQIMSLLKLEPTATPEEKMIHRTGIIVELVKLSGILETEVKNLQEGIRRELVEEDELRYSRLRSMQRRIMVGNAEMIDDCAAGVEVDQTV